MKSIKYILVLLIIASLNSCIIVKKFESEEKERVVELSPKPSIAMSEEVLRPEQGDMIASLPKGWFLIDTGSETPPEVFAVAVNSDYTLTAVFAEIPKNSGVDSKFKKDGLLGTAKHSYIQKTSRTGGRAQLTNDYQILEAGNLSFGKYEYSTTGGALLARTVVFKTSLQNYYEFTLIPTDVIGKPYPSQKEQEKIFNSIVATIKY